MNAENRLEEDLILLREESLKAQSLQMASGTKEESEHSEDPGAVRQRSWVKRHVPRAREQVGSP